MGKMEKRRLRGKSPRVLDRVLENGAAFWQNSKWAGHKGREGHRLYQEVRSQKGKATLDSPEGLTSGQEAGSQTRGQEALHRMGRGSEVHTVGWQEGQSLREGQVYVEVSRRHCGRYGQRGRRWEGKGCQGLKEAEGSQKSGSLLEENRL